MLCVLLSVAAFAQQKCIDEIVGGRATSETRYYYQNQKGYLVLEFLYDGLFRFEYSGVQQPPGLNEKFFTSPMIARTGFPGPSELTREGNRFETPSQIVHINPETLCLSIYDKRKGLALTTLCPDQMQGNTKSLSIDPYQMKHVYGLGQYPTNAGQADGDWVGRVWEPGPDGHIRREFAGGGPSFCQFPIMYALGEQSQNYALFLDTVYRQRWDFSRQNQWWKVDMGGNEIRGYFFTGDNLKVLRQNYMDLVGRPTVPPKNVFGLWVSEFGFDGWGEIEHKLSKLREKKFPVDGFALDLQWFGGRFNEPDSSRMGSLDWDYEHFPDPTERIKNFRAQGINFMPIEESYVHHTLPEHQRMAERGYLVRDGSNEKPVFINSNPWWGRGGMIDWTNPAAGAFWHDNERMPLITTGINAHWLDLGEPEMYDPNANYHGVIPGRHWHMDVHNIYALMWAKSISDGYHRNKIRERQFLLSRAGTSGIQRFGAGMWSGDVGANSANLAAHANMHMHTSFSGIDYFGSDAGGFFRWSLDMPVNELYTQWFALSSLIDTPTRPHAWNLDGKVETSPAEIGDVPSNLENIRLRYALIPYYYTLAHRAHNHGEAVIAPLVYHFQNDRNVRQMGHQMMIGPDLMMGMVARAGELWRNVYLPEGRWFDWYTNEAFGSHGQYLNQVPLYRNGKFKLPLYAKAGAIIPMAHVDENTLSSNGLRTDGGKKDDLLLRVYPTYEGSSFELIEDDGVTRDFEKGAARRTGIWQKIEGDTAKVTIGAAVGTYEHAPTGRWSVVEMVTADARASSVRILGNPVREVFSAYDFHTSSTPCFWNVGRNLILLKNSWRAVSRETTFEVTLQHQNPRGALYAVCYDGNTNFGESVYITGNIPELGNWDPTKAIKLHPSLTYPTWTGTIDNLPIRQNIEWKCLKKRDDGLVTQWQAGPNQRFFTESVYPIVSEGRF